MPQNSRRKSRIFCGDQENRGPFRVFLPIFISFHEIRIHSCDGVTTEKFRVFLKRKDEN